MPAATQRYFAPPNLCDFSKFFVNRVPLVKAMAVSASKRAECSTEDGFANVTVISSRSVERLFASVINAGNSQRAQVQRDCAENQLVSLVVSAEAGLVISFSNLVVVIDHRHHFVAEPDVRIFLHLQ